MTEQLPDERVQVPAGVPVKIPDPLLLNVMVPDGIVALEEASVTVTVHLVETPTLTELGAQVTEVEVE